MKYSRDKVVSLAKSWLGLKVSDGSYMTIIDLYNTQKNPPRGLKMQKTWSWCACTWSALAIKLGYEKIMPIEISCGNLIAEAKKMGIWQENDGYIPKPGDAILYDWDDSGKGDNVGWPDHIGVIETVSKSAGYFTVIEGNYSNSVKRRTVSINGKYIRGFITPKYTDDAVVKEKKFDNDNLDSVARKLIAEGFHTSADIHRVTDRFTMDEVQERVFRIVTKDAYEPKHAIQDQRQPYEKKVICSCKAELKDGAISGSYTTTANLYCRNDAGTNKKALCLIPNGTKVECKGERTGNWYVVQVVLDGILFKGFCHNKYLKKN